MLYEAGRFDPMLCSQGESDLLLEYFLRGVDQKTAC